MTRSGHREDELERGVIESENMNQERLKECKRQSDMISVGTVVVGMERVPRRNV